MAEDDQVSNEGEQAEQENPEIQQAVNTIAFNIMNFVHNQKNGVLEVRIAFEEGEIKQDGFLVNASEKKK